MLTERSKWQRNKHTTALATPNRISVKLLHLIMPLPVIPWSPPCLFCVPGIHRERNHGATRSTRPITVHERTAICKSQLQPIIENPGNTRGEQAFGRWFADGLYRGLASSATQASCIQPTEKNECERRFCWLQTPQRVDNLLMPVDSYDNQADKDGRGGGCLRQKWYNEGEDK